MSTRTRFVIAILFTLVTMACDVPERPKSERYNYIGSTCILPDSASHSYALALSVEARQVDSTIAIQKVLTDVMMRYVTNK